MLAEKLSLNSSGACAECGGTGIVCVVDESTLVLEKVYMVYQIKRSARRVRWPLSTSMRSIIPLRMRS